MEKVELKVGMLVVRPKDKREGRIVAMRDTLSEKPKYQVIWNKGNKRWVSDNDFIVKVVA